MAFMLGLFIGVIAASLGWITWGYKAIGETYRDDLSNVGSHDEHETAYDEIKYKEGYND